MAKVESPRSSATSALSFYIHIPYCSKRCGYCDFNTYTPKELGTADLALITTPYVDSAINEIELAKRQVGQAIVPTIFFGGGTPSLMPSGEIARLISSVRENFEISSEIEVTLEANPDTITEKYLSEIFAAGVNRLSMGMQSAVSHVLAALDRTHDPANVKQACEIAKRVGFEHISVDLIYGVPGESLADWQASYETAFSLPIDHISAYALIVETGTKLAAQVKRGELVMPSDDETAEKYLAFDGAAERAGFAWYELSNWAKPGGHCRHNIAYWNGSYWWGIGPGAHSYLNGKRWWNVKHPLTYQSAINSGQSPEANSELLSEENMRAEFIMLQIRMREGIELARLDSRECEQAKSFRDSGHIDGEQWHSGRLVLTPSGRLIADRIVREMLV
jgi:putative oxygen-independent coproporphyrinogen III oxidase